LASVTVNDSIVVEPYWTLGSVFPNGNGINISPTPGNRNTEVLFPDTTSVGINLSAAKIYFFNAGIWKQVSQGTANHNDDPILPTQHFVVRHNVATNTTLVALGKVITAKFAISFVANPATGQDNYIGLARPTSLSLNNSQLISSGAFAASPLPGNHTDELLTFDNTSVTKNKSSSAIYYYWNSAWRRVGAGSADVGSDLVFTPGVGVIVRKGTNAAGALWVNLPNY
jgi:uncharacterized protein (TIGR02597 family)